MINKFFKFVLPKIFMSVIGIDDILVWSAVAQGLGELGKATGVFKSPEQKAQEKEDNRREAMRKYLEANMPNFEYQKKAYNPADYADVLNPMQERLGGQQQAMANASALGGSARGGVGQALQLGAMRKGNQDIGQMGTQLARQGDEQAWQRAMQLYQANLEKSKMMANLQG